MAAKVEISKLSPPQYGRPLQAADDEPVFILRARDILAPRVVVRWAHLAELARVPAAKVDGALRRAKEMADWQAQHPDRVKVPD